MAIYETDPLYLGLKAALNSAKTEKERHHIYATMKALRFDEAVEDPDTPHERVVGDAVPGGAPGTRFP